MKYRPIFILTLLIPSLFASTSNGQGPPPAAPSAAPAATTDESLSKLVTPVQPAPKKQQLQTFAFEGAPLEVVMEEYSRWTGKIFLKTDAVKANITLKADRLTTEESIKVVEAILALNNIALVPMGDKYVKVIPATAGDLTGQGLPINIDQDTVYEGSDKFVTQIIQLQNAEIPEVQAAVQHVMHAYGKIMALQRSNSLMLTDTEANIKRARDIIEFIDQASAPVEPRIYEIKHAEASDIASKLNEIVAAAQEADDKPSGAVVGNPDARTPPGVIRARQAQAQRGATPAATKASISQTESGSTTIIHGTVKIMADERTNVLLIFSQEENFAFFDKIIAVLDVEVEPAINFEVINLEYADATELSGTLNELVGAATGSRSTSPTAAGGTSARNTSTSRNRTSTSRSSNTNTRNQPADRVTPNASPEGSGIQNLSRLSENTKILADERSNSILLMGEKGDISALKNVIKSLDVMLEQVVIEAAIFEIGLNEKLQHGMQWLYQSQDQNKLGGWDVNSIATNGLKNVTSGALSYFQNVTGINTELAINLAATDTDSRLLATPVIMTTDNTEARLSIGEQRPVVTSTDSFGTSSGTLRSSYEYKDIGIQLTVTPRINPQRFVVMEISQQADQLGGTVTIDNNSVPIILNREFEASIAVPDRGTIALGGLITPEFDDSISKIPILGDIPLIGRYLFSSVNKTEVQRELLVLLTPYVMTTHEDLLEETERLYRKTKLSPKDWSWSESQLRLIPDEEAQETVQ